MTDKRFYILEKTKVMGDDHTSGCIRVKQEELDWLVENVDVGTTVVM